MDESGDLPARPRWARGARAPRRGRPHRVDLGHRQERELGQVLGDLAVVGLHPVLEELVRAGAAGSSQTLAPVVLPSFVPSGAVRSGQASPWTAAPLDRPDQVDAGQDVAPLVGAADLQLDPSCSWSHR